MNTVRIPAVIFFPLFLIVGGCSLNYDESDPVSEFDKEIPVSILTNFKYLKIKNGLPVFKISAIRAESYDKKKETRMEKVSFWEYDNAGKVVTEGKADRAVYYIETEDAEFSGNLYFYSTSEETKIYGSYLFWDSSETTLTGKPGESVSLTTDSGSKISGKGFKADAGNRKIEFSEETKGEYVYEEEK